MLGNYIKIAFRRLKLLKIYSIISIAGLAVGLASCFIIFLYVSYQLSFDKHNKNIDNIYLIYFHDLYADISFPTTPLILAPTLKAEFPEIDKYARWRKKTCTIKYHEMILQEENCVFAEPSIFDILTLPLINGNFLSFSSQPNSIILSETSVKKYFNKKDPIGEILTVNFNGTDYLLKVVAIIKDIPKTSTFTADFILPLTIFEKYRMQERAKLPANMFSLWDFPEVYTYVLISPNCNIKEFQKKLSEFSKRPEHRAGGNPVNYSLFPMKDIYFNSSFMINNEFPQGDITNILIYSCIAFLNLLIAVITFLMISAGKSTLLTKEIAIRKTIGASKIDLLIQSIIESSIITIVALPLSIILVELFLPDISLLIGNKILSSYYHNFSYLIIFWTIALLLGFISGSYLSFYFSKFNPIDIMKNKITTGANKVVLRKIMLSIQMIIFMALVFASVVIYKQLNFFLNKDLGYVKEGLVIFYPEDTKIGKSFEVFKSEIKKHPDIIDVSCSNILPGSNESMSIEVPNKYDNSNLVRAELLLVDKDFIETMKMNMKQGLSFRQRNITDSSGVCIINETAVKEFGIKNPIGEKLLNLEIIGVVKDFNIHSLHNKINSVIISTNTKRLSKIIVRIRDGAIKSNVIDFVRQKSSLFNNNKPMDFQYYDEKLGELYYEEQNFGKLIRIFTIVAIFLSCVGLFGISLFLFNQKTKEIGIRKVLGANLPSLLYVITKEIIFTALISAAISFPISYMLITKWLDNFAYKVSLNLWVYLVSFLIMMTLVALAISFQAIKVAIANPIKYLRYE